MNARTIVVGTALRGYLGIPLIGRTTYWLRVGAEEHLCRVTQTSTIPVQETHP